MRRRWMLADRLVRQGTAQQVTPTDRFKSRAAILYDFNQFAAAWLGTLPFFQPLMWKANDRDDRCRTQKEAAARAALELCTGRALTDAEWAATRARLLKFVGILRVWDRKTAASTR